MKRLLSVFLTMALLVGCLTGCDLDSGGSKKNKNLLELDMYGYDASVLMVGGFAGETEPVSFVLTGQLPAQEPDEGNYDGQICVVDAQGQRHIYRNMTYRWIWDEYLMLEGEDSSVGLLYDPESPERSIFIDSYWGKDDVAMTVRVIMEEGLSEAEAMAIETKLQRIDQVDSCRFISAQHALDDFAEDSGLDISGIDTSTLQHRYEVTLKLGADDHAAVAALEKLEGVDTVLAETPLLWVRIFSAYDDPEKAMELFTELSDRVEAYMQ